MSSPWQQAYAHPNFARFTRERIDEMTLDELGEVYMQEDE